MASITTHCQTSCLSSEGMSWKEILRWLSTTLRMNVAEVSCVLSRRNERPLVRCSTSPSPSSGSGRGGGFQGKQ